MPLTIGSDDRLVRRLCVLMLGTFIGLVLGAIAIKNVRDGEFGAKGGTVSRKENPARFWFTTVFCGLASVVCLVATGNYVFFSDAN